MLLPHHPPLATRTSVADRHVRARKARSILITRQLLQRLSLGLLDQQRTEAAEQHEQGKNLQHVVEPRARVFRRRAVKAEGCDGALANDGADLE